MIDLFHFKQMRCSRCSWYPLSFSVFLFQYTLALSTLDCPSVHLSTGFLLLLNSVFPKEWHSSGGIDCCLDSPPPVNAMISHFFIFRKTVILYCTSLLYLMMHNPTRVCPLTKSLAGVHIRLLSETRNYLIVTDTNTMKCFS